MAFHRNASRNGLILIVVLVAAIVVAVTYPRARPNQDTPSGVRVAVPPQPNWKELKPEQQSILAPLEEDWNNMERFRRKKWLEIAARYPKLNEAEQERVRERMQEWANLTPAQRQTARDRFRELSKQNNAEERAALAQKWADYQSLPEGVRGEAWEVHGGGFYHVQKYLSAPSSLPAHLTWFKWEAYLTWVTGFFLLAVVYYVNASANLIDPAVANLAPWQAIVISLVSIVAGWAIYDGLCRSPIGRNTGALAADFGASPLE